MNDMVFLFPGQGSQHVGMGRGLWERYASVKRVFEEASDLLHSDLKALCFQGPEGTLVRTENVQPAITLVNLATVEALREEGVEPCAAAGHSLGEYSALCVAGVISFADTMRLVQFRGAVMQEAAGRYPGGMVAVFGLAVDRLVEICREAESVGVVELANHNSAGQVVLTGERQALERAGQLARQRGAKLLVPLKVSGPWHSRFMTEAKECMRARMEACEVRAPAIPVISNFRADAYPRDPAGIRTVLAEQMVHPVLWADSMHRLLLAGHRSFTEAGPGKVLAGLMRDISREAKVYHAQDAAQTATPLS